jgi:hypothetical protein
MHSHNDVICRLGVFRLLYRTHSWAPQYNLLLEYKQNGWTLEFPAYFASQDLHLPHKKPIDNAQAQL